MAFIPYIMYVPRLPALKAGHLVEAVSQVWQVKEVRRNRNSIDLAAAHSETPLNSETNSNWQWMNGQLLEEERIVHLQYLALSTALATSFKWGVDQLLSKNVVLNLTNVLAGVVHPLELDKWSYAKEQHLKVTKLIGAQTLYLEVMEYTMAEYGATVPRDTLFLKITSDGMGRMVRAV
jgi:hypothetical protein